MIVGEVIVISGRGDDSDGGAAVGGGGGGEVSVKTCGDSLRCRYGDTGKEGMVSVVLS